MMILSRKKAANLYLFAKSSKWMTSGQNAGLQGSKKVLSGRPG